MIRVLLVDDQALLRMGFRLILETEPDIEVVGEAADGAAGVAMASALRPDVVLMDVRMPGMDGIAATAAITAAGPGQQGHHPHHLRPRRIRLRRAQGGRQRFPAQGRAAGGSDHRHPQRRQRRRRPRPGRDPAAHHQFTALLPDPGRQQNRDAIIDKLTDREQTVFAQLAAGRSNREIAADLYLSEGTVKVHVGRILAKLGLRDRVQAVVLAYESGLITPGG